MIEFVFKSVGNAKKIVAIILLTICTWGYSIVFPYLSGRFIDVLIYGNGISTIKSFLIIITILNLLNILALYNISMIYSILKPQVSYNVVKKINKHLQKIEYIEYMKYKPIYLMQRVSNDSDSVVNFVLDNFIAIFTSLLSIIFAGVMIFNISNNIFITVIVFIPIYLCSYFVLSKYIYMYSLKLKESKSIYGNDLAKQYTEMKNIRIDANYEKYCENLDKSFESLRYDLVKANKFFCIFNSLEDIIGMVVQIIIFIISAISIINKTISIGQFSTLLIYFNTIISAIKYYLGMLKEYQNSKTSYDRIMELMNMKKEQNGTVCIEKIDRIEFNKFEFRYPGENYYIYEGFSQEFLPNNIYAIVGENGSGKTTLINNLLGLFNGYYKGNIRINNFELREIDMYSLRKRLIAVGQQENNLGETYVKDVFSNYNINSLENIREEISLLNMDKMFLNEMFSIIDFWDCEIKNLSGGERQKICILKALLKKTNVLIFDEPTAALDRGSTETFIDLLTEIKKNMIVVIISHDEKLISISDEIIKI